MGIPNRILNCIVAAGLAAAVFFSPAGAAEQDRLDRLHGQLREADPGHARRIAGEIELEWSKSGSPAMNLLLKRGTDALEAGETRAAIEHFTALTDHAPDFAEGWHRRALAFAAAEMFGPAVADLERALALSPRHYDAIAALGGILVEIDRPDMARQAFERVLALHPHHPEAARVLAHLQGRTGGAEL